MSILLAFIFIYFAAFILYASSYSSKMQDLSADEKMKRIPGIDLEKIQLRIQRRNKSVASLRKVGWVSVISLFTTHVVIIVLFTKNSLQDILIAVVLGVAFLILMIIINWLKGSGTIDSNARMHRNPEF